MKKKNYIFNTNFLNSKISLLVSWFILMASMTLAMNQLNNLEVLISNNFNLEYYIVLIKPNQIIINVSLTNSSIELVTKYKIRNLSQGSSLY